MGAVFERSEFVSADKELFETVWTVFKRNQITDIEKFFKSAIWTIFEGCNVSIAAI